ncbi:hypothetical protein EK21DRAFT_112341 [Setomelanomma holmii]|uniref:DUF7896 domain-containing protein n=1 Tax=Setomelanomma holmii TaxID=210430 RepID=A0A9P4LLP6_9PLEO|nr:hypothetical protein EK21DRAFT_112341 [Setomelanomma holmii]
MPSTMMFGSSDDADHVLEQTKHNFMLLSNEQRQEFISTLGSNAFGTSQATMAQQTPRTMPSASLSAQFPSSSYEYTARNPSAPDMGRSVSASSDMHALQRSNSSMSAWQASSQDSTSAYTHYSNASSQDQSTLQSIAESTSYNDNTVEWTPDDYVANNCVEQASSLSLPNHPQQLQLTSTFQWGLSPDGSTSPSTPSTALMTPVTYASNMSRQGSYNPQFLEDTSMLRIQSDSSFAFPAPSDDGAFPYSLNVDSKAISSYVDGSLFSPFSGSPSEVFLSALHSAPVGAQAIATPENDMPYLAEDMRRSASATSDESNASDASAPSSTCSRQSRRESEISAAAARKIAPKAIEINHQTESAPSNAQMARIRSEDGSSKTVGVITKTPYVRPQHPKIMCQYCNERPEGFRGTHELERHVARAHAPSRKGYICIDGSADKQFLARCKHCKNKKVYGAYYNAAAHLRRAHFHPRKRGRKGKNDEKRGGIGGGDDPPMDYLKMHWIREIDVDNNPTPSSPACSSDDANDHVDTSYQSIFKTDAAAVSYPAQQAMPLAMTNQVHINANQFVDYSMSAQLSEPVMFDANTLNSYDNIAPSTTDMNSFQFDAYM